jgi:hypothetical protein
VSASRPWSSSRSTAPTPRITKLELTAATGQTLATSRLPAIDLERLLASVQPATTPHVTPALAVAVAAATGPAAADLPAPPRKRQASTGRGQAKPAATAPAAKSSPKATKKQATSKTATSRKKTAEAKPESTGRAYRTMA